MSRIAPLIAVLVAATGCLAPSSHPIALDADEPLTFVLRETVFAADGELRWPDRQITFGPAFYENVTDSWGRSIPAIRLQFPSMIQDSEDLSRWIVEQVTYSFLQHDLEFVSWTDSDNATIHSDLQPRFHLPTSGGAALGLLLYGDPDGYRLTNLHDDVVLERRAEWDTGCKAYRIGPDGANDGELFVCLRDGHPVWTLFESEPWSYRYDVVSSQGNLALGGSPRMDDLQAPTVGWERAPAPWNDIWVPPHPETWTSWDAVFTGMQYHPTWLQFVAQHDELYLARGSQPPDQVLADGAAVGGFLLDVSTNDTTYSNGLIGPYTDVVDLPLTLKGGAFYPLAPFARPERDQLEQQLVPFEWIKETYRHLLSHPDHWQHWNIGANQYGGYQGTPREATWVLSGDCNAPGGGTYVVASAITGQLIYSGPMLTAPDSSACGYRST